MSKTATKKGKTKEETDEPTTLSGTFMFPNGDKYEGEFTKSADSKMERSGTGNYLTAEGMQYSGNWVNDKMNGKGRLVFPSGAVYEGNFVDNKFHGTGQYTWPNGSSYMGDFNNNRLEGGGEFTDTDKQVWSGDFLNKAATGLRFKFVI